MHIQPGTIVGGYRIERVLGAGGMGTVYLARHPSLPRQDALKMLSAEASADAEYRARFEREANLAGALDHPNIVAVYNRGETHGRLWIAMQYVAGTDAAAAVKNDPSAMTPARALRIVTEVGRGLDHAHRRGLLHRDVKPANFLLSTVDGEQERVLLTDFGVAKSTADTIELTQAGAFVATIAYAAPEQLSGGTLDHHTDIYSLACAFFTLLTGRNPYPGTQPALVMMGHLYEPPPLVTQVHPELPPALNQVLAVAMAKDPAQRFHSCHEFTSALESALVDGVSGLSEPTEVNRFGREAAFPPPPAKAAAGKGRWIAAGAAVVIVALAAGVGVWAAGSTDPDQIAAPSPTTTVTAPRTVAEARQQNPAFLGKVIAAVDLTGESSRDGEVDLHLTPGPQAEFLESLGMVYNFNGQRVGDEPSPRSVSGTAGSALNSLRDMNSGFILAVRSDTAAGNGSLMNMPLAVSMRSVTVLVLDDPIAVDAFRNWTDRSEQILLDKLLPVLRKGVK